MLPEADILRLLVENKARLHLWLCSVETRKKEEATMILGITQVTDLDWGRVEANALVVGVGGQDGGAVAVRALRVNGEGERRGRRSRAWLTFA